MGSFPRGLWACQWNTQDVEVISLIFGAIRKYFENSMNFKNKNKPFNAFGGALVVIKVYTSDHGPAPESFFAHIRKLYEVFSCNLFILCE